MSGGIVCVHRDGASGHRFIVRDLQSSLDGVFHHFAGRAGHHLHRAAGKGGGLGVLPDRSQGVAVSLITDGVSGLVLLPICILPALEFVSPGTGRTVAGDLYGPAWLDTLIGRHSRYVQRTGLIDHCAGQGHLTLDGISVIIRDGNGGGLPAALHRVTPRVQLDGLAVSIGQLHRIVGTVIRSGAAGVVDVDGHIVPCNFCGLIGVGIQRPTILRAAGPAEIAVLGRIGSTWYLVQSAAAAGVKPLTRLYYIDIDSSLDLLWRNALEHIIIRNHVLPGFVLFVCGLQHRTGTQLRYGVTLAVRPV